MCNQYVWEEYRKWEEAIQKAHEMREELRVQFELRNSYGELRNQLEEWGGEDKQWKAREVSNRRANVGRNLPTIPEGMKSKISKIQIPTILKISEQKSRQMQWMIWF